MNIFNLFKKKIVINDDIFGPLTYTTFKDPLKNFYSGAVIFHSNQIEILLHADKNGPEQKQKDFFLQLKDNYASLKEDIIIPFLKKEPEDWLNENSIEDFDKVFLIEAIDLPCMKNNPVEWSISYECLPIKHTVTVNFLNMTPKFITVDG